ncbi:hypothetical protein CLAFUW4_07204 [Fulvia fulva]|uniref:Uncharacterized protein n=1 Tax=Passalora fulva TaxID=5499 RepID=A0A9Q8PAK5_PASFU|nr:uncharacterized protein CLAFUR5_07338 [Fulvia fulva]KAK4622173.1 hypothetical protein CLAFUR4_07212 [Fulvia fulva]KAK4623221.1 hypothetical protein CLAFUR0_07209 [Fulvia fulva]UJO18900.1 hypothetical protein CLAFUR5_07338 [Fulvia fulva]WPV16231.1 hypothetical protein CLAFUW4_07204 [Fulvia fulva]WPV30757.1 hypothetical protein CLAFUW7_07205 [Fulvia fulva]
MGSMKLKRVMLLEFSEALEIKPELESGEEGEEEQDGDEDEDTDDDQSLPRYGLNFLFRSTSDRTRQGCMLSKVFCLHPAMPEYLTGPNATTSFWFEGTSLSGTCGADDPTYLTAAIPGEITAYSERQLVAHAMNTNGIFENMSWKGYLAAEA